MNETNEFSFILKPSLIEDAGIGIFSTHNIKKGTILLLAPKNYKGRIIKKKDMNGDNHDMIHHFCLFREDHFVCPEEFNRPYIMWYINHSFEPNAEFVDNTYYSIRDIQKGEEILCDYNTFNEPEDIKEEYYKK